jgi:xanthine dehydrogenase accessory factor
MPEPASQDFYVRLHEIVSAGLPAALCTVVGSHGSTPQEPGAKMAVLGDLSIVGTIGGGCVEAEVVRRAGRLIGGERPELLSFSLDSDYGWDDGLICGGTLHVLADRLRPHSDGPMLARLLEARRAGKPQVLATVVRAGGACSGRRLVFEAGAPIPAEIAALVPPAEAASLVERCLRRGRPYSHRADAAGAPVTAKGAAAEPTVAVEVFFEPILPRCRLVIAGAGHVGRALATLAALLEFDVVVVDDRDTYANPERFPRAERIVVGDIPRSLAAMESGPHTYFVVVTRGHKHDCDALYAVIRKPAGYLGLIGSKRKIQLIYDAVRAQGVSEADIARVYAPIGVEIGSRTPAEIAVSIAAQLVQVRSGEFTPEQIRSRHAQPMTYPG